MGELTGELGEGYRRLMEKKRKIGAASVKGMNSGDDVPTLAKTPTRNVPKEKQHDNIDAITEAELMPFIAENPAPSSTSKTRKGSAVSPSRIVRRLSQPRTMHKKRTRDILSKFQKYRRGTLRGVEAVKATGKVDEERLIHISSGLSSMNASSISGVSAETKRMGNTSRAKDSSHSRGSSTQIDGGNQLIEADYVKSAKTNAETENDEGCEDSFLSLDWNSIEQSIDVLNISKESDLTSLTMSENLVEGSFDPPKDNFSVTSALSQQSEQRLYAILEEQADTLFQSVGASKAYQPNMNFEESQRKTKQSKKQVFKATFDAIQFNADDFANPFKEEIENRAPTQGNGEVIEKRVARAYHRPHTGEKVVVNVKGDRDTDNAAVTPEVAAKGDTAKSEESKDDGDSKSDTSGQPSFMSLRSEKNRRKDWNRKPKRKARKSIHVPSQIKKDGDPLGRAVSIAFDQFAGYAAAQDDMAAAVPLDELTIDEEEYLSDESENIITDIHDALFSTFGCSVPRTRLPLQLNDDDTFDTDGGSKVSLERHNAFIRHTESSSNTSDSVCSDASPTLPSVVSYDKTEGTREDDPTRDDDMTDEMTDNTKKSAEIKPQKQAPKYKVPDSFHEEPPMIPKSLSMTDSLPNVQNSSSSFYSKSTDLYKNFVEMDHDAVDFLEETDDFLFSDDIGENLCKAANTSVDKLVASIQGIFRRSRSATCHEIQENPVEKNKTTHENMIDIDPRSGHNEADTSKEVTATDFSTGLEENSGVIAVKASFDIAKPIETKFKGNDPLQRPENIFASQKEVRLDHGNKDIGKNILKGSNKNVDKLVASIQGLFGKGTPGKSQETQERKIEKDKTSKETTADINPPTVDAEVDSTEKATSMDFSDALEELSGGIALRTSLAVEKPIKTNTKNNEELQRQESLFAASPRDARLEHGSDTGSDNTLEELKVRLIEEARAMPAIATTSESVMSSLVEEEKKEEDSIKDDSKQDQPEVQGFEFDGSLFTEETTEFDVIGERNGFADFGHKITISGFCESTNNSVENERAGDDDDKDWFYNVFANHTEKESLPIGATKSSLEQIEVSKNYRVLISSDATRVESSPAPTDEQRFCSSDDASSIFLLSDRLGSSFGKFEPYFAVQARQAGPEEGHVEGFDVSFESIEGRLEAIPPPIKLVPSSDLIEDHDPQFLSTNTDVASSLVLETPPDSCFAVQVKTKLQSRMQDDVERFDVSFESSDRHLAAATSPDIATVQEKKKRGVGMKGFFQSFRKRKEPKSFNTPAAPVGKKRGVDKNAETSPDSLKRNQTNDYCEAVHDCSSAVSTSKSFRKNTHPSRMDVNNLMETYLSQKFKKESVEHTHHETLIESFRANPCSEGSNVRTEAQQPSSGAPVTLDMTVATPERIYHNKMIAPFGVDISPFRNNNHSQGWDVSDFEKAYTEKNYPISSVFRRDLFSRSSIELSTDPSVIGMKTPERKVLKRHKSPNALVKWESVNDSRNEGIDLRADSESTSSSAYSQPPSADWNSILERPGTAFDDMKSKLSLGPANASPQKVSDFPFLSNEDNV